MNAPESYLIRGHHLEYYAEIVSGQLSPEESASSFRLGITSSSDADYVADVFGKDTATAAQTETNFVKAFSRFVELAPEDPVKITYGEKDAICVGCAVGDHCMAAKVHELKIRSKVKSISKADIDDMYEIAKFSRIAVKLGYEGSLDQEENPFRWMGVIPGTEIPIVYEEPIITSAAVTRSVLSHWDMLV